MRSDKYVEIKEAQPRETTTATHPNMSHMFHNKVRRDGNVHMMTSNASSFVPGMNHMVVNSESSSMIDPSYMGITYGQVPADVPPQSPSVRRGLINFTPYYTTEALPGSPQLYLSNVHYSNNTLFVHENTVPTSDEGQTNIINNNMFLQPPPMSPPHVLMSYGELYDPNYGNNNLYVSSTMTTNGTSNDLTSNQQPPHFYPISTPYYNSQYISPPNPEMTNHRDTGSPHRMNHSFNQTSMTDNMSPSRSFYMPSSYLPSRSFQPPLMDDPQLEHSSSSPPQFFSLEQNNIDPSSLHSVVAEQHLNPTGVDEGIVSTTAADHDNNVHNENTHLREANG
jgi:hypothetical protein